MGIIMYILTEAAGRTETVYMRPQGQHPAHGRHSNTVSSLLKTYILGMEERKEHGGKTKRRQGRRKPGPAEIRVRN